jgi:DNA invertase Pin-like site-specific DNA recombinase
MKVAHPRRDGSRRHLSHKSDRKPKMSESKTDSANRLLASDMPPNEVARNVGVSVPTLYRWVPAGHWPTYDFFRFVS